MMAVESLSLSHHDNLEIKNKNIRSQIFKNKKFIKQKIKI